MIPVTGYEKLQKQLDEHIDFAEKRRTQRFYKSEIQRFSKEKGEKEGRIEACKKRIETTEKEDAKPRSKK